jgi:hypothetical protein
VGACGSGEREPETVRVKALVRLWVRGENRSVDSSSERVGSKKRDVQVEDPLALELTPTCQEILWPVGLAGVSSEV